MDYTSLDRGTHPSSISSTRPQTYVTYPTGIPSTHHTDSNISLSTSLSTNDDDSTMSSAPLDTSIPAWLQPFLGRPIDASSWDGPDVSPNDLEQLLQIQYLGSASGSDLIGDTSFNHVDPNMWISHPLQPSSFMQTEEAIQPTHLPSSAYMDLGYHLDEQGSVQFSFPSPQS